ncbi:MAG: hypothetical protein QHJ82_17585, partial [Verrucomicrobiota bacterium]|nr:hypothetical protein [Verrucomicrobiota bacterium]
CLSPYRHPMGSSADFGNDGLQQGTICPPPHNQGTKPKQSAWHFIQLTSEHRAVVSALLAAKETDTEKLTELAA